MDVLCLDGEVVVGFPHERRHEDEDLRVTVWGEGFVQGETVEMFIDELNGLHIDAFQVVHVLFFIPGRVLFHSEVRAVILVGLSEGFPSI